MNWVKNACTKKVKLCNSDSRFITTIISLWGKDEDIITKESGRKKKKKKDYKDLGIKMNRKHVSAWP